MASPEQVADPNEFEFDDVEHATEAMNAGDLYSLGPANSSPQRTRAMTMAVNNSGGANLNDSLEP